MLTMDATASPLLEEILGGAFELRSLLADHLEIEQGQDASVWRAVHERLDTLTPAQKALFPLVRDHWLRVGLSTARADRDAAECAMCDVYRQVELAVPRMVWCESPFQGVVKANQVAPSGDQSLGSFRHSVLNRAINQVHAQVVEQVAEQVRDQVRELVWDQVWDLIRDQIWELAWNQVWDQVWEKVVQPVRWYSGHGSQDADWLSFYAMFGVLGLDVSPLVPLMRLVHHCGWYFAFRDRVILTEKPVEIAWRNGRCVGVWYADGWGFGEHA